VKVAPLYTIYALPEGHVIVPLCELQKLADGIENAAANAEDEYNRGYLNAIKKFVDENLIAAKEDKEDE
jgi:hypothetical protein